VERVHGPWTVVVRSNLEDPDPVEGTQLRLARDVAVVLPYLLDQVSVDLHTRPLTILAMELLNPIVLATTLPAPTKKASTTDMEILRIMLHKNAGNDAAPTLVTSQRDLLVANGRCPPRPANSVQASELIWLFP